MTTPSILALGSASALIDEFLARHSTISILPENTSRIIRMIRDPECSIGQLEKIVVQDAALAGRIIRVVNSSFYAPQNRITRLDLAISFIGLTAIKQIVLSETLSALCGPLRFGRYDARDLWDHSVGVAIVTRELSARSGQGDQEENFLAGMLHDLALLLVTQAEPEKATRLLTRAEANPARPFAESEQEIFGFTHGQLGERLAAAWRLPESSAAAIAWHHEPEQAPPEHRRLCELIYIADTLTCGVEVGCPLTCTSQVVTDDELAAAGITRDTATEVTGKLRILLRLYMP